MNKKLLTGLIEKYNLGGTIESVKWVVKDNVVKVDFVSEDKSLIGSTVLNKLEMEDAEFGVYTTSELTKMLSVLEDDITIEPVKVADKYRSLKINDKSFKMTYVLSDPAIIPPAPNLKTLPPFEVKIDVKKEFVDNFLKAKTAISDSDSFAVQSMAEDVVLTVGYSDNNTNRTSFKTVGVNTSDIGPLQFSVEQLKNILVSNKDFVTGTIEISSKGLLRVVFTNKEYTSTYFLVKLQNV